MALVSLHACTSPHAAAPPPLAAAVLPMRSHRYTLPRAAASPGTVQPKPLAACRRVDYLACLALQRTTETRSLSSETTQPRASSRRLCKAASRRRVVVVREHGHQTQRRRAFPLPELAFFSISSQNCRRRIGEDSVIYSTPRFNSSRTKDPFVSSNQLADPI